MSEVGFRNEENLRAWREAWVMNGGSFHWIARSMVDFRNQDQLRQWRLIEFKVRATGRSKSKSKVVNLAAWYLKRARNGRQTTSRALA